MSAKTKALLAFVLVTAISASASATTLYDNIDATSTGTDPVTTATGFGPLADSFSTLSASFSLTDVQLLLEEGSAPSGGSLTVQLLSDNATSPGSVLTTIGTLSDSSLTPSLSIFDFPLAMPYTLAPDTRYWLELFSTNTVADWSFSTDTSGTGVAGEFFFSNGVGSLPNAPDGSPWQMQISGTANAIPEPMSLALLGTAIAGLGLFRRRRRSPATNLRHCRSSDVYGR